MSHPSEIGAVLRENLTLYQELLDAIESECGELRESTGGPLVRQYEVRKKLLPRLGESLRSLARSRAIWQGTDAAGRAGHPDVDELVRQSQDLLMKIIVLDRENEQTLLRQGRLGARDLPSVNQRRPHFVSELYRRQGGS
jgi:hypothetical protein